MITSLTRIFLRAGNKHIRRFELTADSSLLTFLKNPPSSKMWRKLLLEGIGSLVHGTGVYLPWKASQLPRDIFHPLLVLYIISALICWSAIHFFSVQCRDKSLVTSVELLFFFFFTVYVKIVLCIFVTHFFLKYLKNLLASIICVNYNPGCLY